MFWALSMAKLLPILHLHKQVSKQAANILSLKWAGKVLHQRRLAIGGDVVWVIPRNHLDGPANGKSGTRHQIYSFRRVIGQLRSVRKRS